jgi:predicted transcriptional regulator
MSMTIKLPPELEESVREYAARKGQDVSGFVVRAVEEKIARERDFEEICAPFAEAVQASGMSDEDFDRFFKEVREDVWREKQGKEP